MNAVNLSPEAVRVLERRMRRDWNEHLHWHQEDNGRCPVCAAGVKYVSALWFAVPVGQGALFGPDALAVTT